jgi:protein-S-isoprenylcysteine O-methyltransferase Ste14
MGPRELAGRPYKDLSGPEQPSSSHTCRSASRAYTAAVQPLWSELRDQWLFVTIALGYVAVVIAVAKAIGQPQAVSIVLYSPVMLVLIGLALFAFALGHVVYVTIVLRPERPLKRIAEDWTGRFEVKQRVFAALPILLVLPVFMSAFTSMKSMIPSLNSFSWDPTFAHWDRLIHGGVDPWRLLQPILGHPEATAILNVIYHKWFLVVSGILIWQATSLRDRFLRQQFFLAFVLSWIFIGSVTALLLPAAGPCYFGRVTGLEDPFQPLMAYLARVHDQGLNPAFAVQEWLWHQYSSGDLVAGGGISAMPSMHVALAALFALLGLRRNALLGWSMVLFALLILVGSVHLGWHYALDGYVAIILVLLCWQFAGAITRATLRSHSEGYGTLTIGTIWIRNYLSKASLSRILDVFERVAVSCLYGLLVFRLALYVPTKPFNLVFLAMEGLVLLLVLMRRPTDQISLRFKDWLIAFSATFLPLLVVPGQSLELGVLPGLVMLVGFGVALWAKLQLRRSFGLVAANRGLKTTGIYRFVRHPMYLGYFLSQFGFLMMNWNRVNVTILSVWAALQLARISAEERVLSLDTSYRAHMDRARYRLLPFVY